MYSLKNDVSPLIKLAIPLALTGMVQCAVWFFETLFLARLGEQTLAAGSLVSWFLATIAVILFGAMSSINILVAHRHGANEHESIALVARDGILQAILLAVPTFILVWNMAPIFLLFGQPESVVVLAKSYLHALAWGILANFLLMACLEVIMGLGHARIILFFSVISVSLNVICSYALIFGKFGFPALGIAGAGWGMTVSYWVTLIVVATFIGLNEQYRLYFRHIFKIEKPTFLLELLQIGLPMGAMYSFEVGFFFTLTILMGIIGTTTQAANQVALQYLGLMMSTMFAVAQAITIRIGHLLGAGDVPTATKASYVGLSIAIIFTSIIAIVYWTYPEVLISADFNIHDPKNVELINVIKKLLAICALFQIIEAVRIALFGSLRALKETKFTMLISIISFWCIALPIGYLLATQLKIGATGYWWSMIMGASVSVFLLQRRFHNKINQFKF